MDTQSAYPASCHVDRDDVTRKMALQATNKPHPSSRDGNPTALSNQCMPSYAGKCILLAPMSSGSHCYTH